MKICLQASPSCAAVVSNVVAVFYLWCSRPGDSQALVWSTQKRQDRDVPGHRAPGRGWQQLPGENGQGWGVLLTRAGRSQTSQVSHHGVHSSRHCQLVHGGAGVGRWSRVPEESSLQRKHACAKSAADEGTESPQGLPQPGTLVRDANCSWHGWSHWTTEPLVWLWAKLYRMTRCRHHEAARPIHPCKTAACKYRHFKWQLRLDMDCTCFP